MEKRKRHEINPTPFTNSSRQTINKIDGVNYQDEKKHFPNSGSNWQPISYLVKKHLEKVVK